MSDPSQPPLPDAPLAAAPTQPPAATPPIPARHRVLRWDRRFVWGLLAGLLLALLSALVLATWYEMRTSVLQARLFSRLAGEARFEVRPGPSPAIRYPGNGPYDLRLGYHQLPQFIGRLAQQSYAVTAQARMSPRMLALHDQGLFDIYPEKPRAGLTLLDCRSQPLYQSRVPERAYERFEDLPPLLVKALLFIENRELLETEPATRNPAIEWARLGRAVLDQLLSRIDSEHSAPGGSTLATQIEKYRHSPDGRTDSAADKLRQMFSASMRAYAQGPNTQPRRRQIVLDYLNTVPLAARGGFGEVHGLGDGLWAWYGRDFTELNQRLARDGSDAATALAFKQALSLMIAQRRPAYYLDEGEADLNALTDSYLRLMVASDAIPTALRDAALAQPLARTPRPPARPGVSFIERKAANAVRGRLAGLLDMPRAYDLDRLDLQARSSLDGGVQAASTAVLRSLTSPAGARAAGLYGFRLLGEGDDTSRLTFSFTLYERGDKANFLRVQTDNVDQPFDLNEGARLDLGSTAKLRTLVTYLELIGELHERWAGLGNAELAALPVSPKDPLGAWARGYLAATQPGAPERGLAAMLDAAMQRRYSASPGEGFFTGGGLHYFDNFEPEDNGRILTVHEALQRSVNLVFIRMMRDVVMRLVYQAAAPGSASVKDLLDDADDPRRATYLQRFADREGRAFLARFHTQYQGKTAPEALNLLLGQHRATPSRLAATYFALEPQASAAQLGAFLDQRLGRERKTAQSEAQLVERYGPGRLSLADRAYLAGVHPLELWLLGYLRQHPTANLSEVVAASVAERQDAYAWLFKTRHKGGQDVRIRQLLELDAFKEIQRRWHRLGYPFDALTPSYASALGASGDRPAALAELMGIIVNQGLRRPVARVPQLRFAAATPYETQLDFQPPPGERVLKPELTQVVRRALIDVVENGTARRLKGALLRPDGSAVAIGGKTGTGDHRFDVYGRGGQLISSRVVNRTATLVFLIGERYYGTMMAFVHEPYAANYKFTSALPSQLLKSLAPALLPLLDDGHCSAEGTVPANGTPALSLTRQ
ncbi:MAG: transglycosylase domain-containing protein [Burkholderiales bacterium]